VTPPTATPTTNDGKVRILLTNVGGSSRTATFHHAVPTVEGLAVADKTVTVAANTTEWTSGWSVANFGRTLQIDVSHADLTLAAPAMRITLAYPHDGHDPRRDDRDRRPPRPAP
jgi:hypothetical protein